MIVPNVAPAKGTLFNFRMNHGLIKIITWENVAKGKIESEWPFVRYRYQWLSFYARNFRSHKFKHKKMLD